MKFTMRAYNQPDAIHYLIPIIGVERSIQLDSVRHQFTNNPSLTPAGGVALHLASYSFIQLGISSSHPICYYLRGHGSAFPRRTSRSGDGWTVETVGFGVGFIPTWVREGEVTITVGCCHCGCDCMMVSN